MPGEEFQQSLADLRARVLDMGELVVDRLTDALESLASGDDQLAQQVIDGDDVVNDTYLAIEEACIELMALQQPVAGDLRFVAASFKIITDLERIGDLAVNLAEYARAADRNPAPEVAVEEIGIEATDLLERSLAAYEMDDAEACAAIAADDDDIDALCARASETVTRDLIEREAGSDAWAVERLLDDVSRLLLTIRDLERVADHAVNIAARTRYMVENDPALLY